MKISTGIRLQGDPTTTSASVFSNVVLPAPLSPAASTTSTVQTGKGTTALGGSVTFIDSASSSSSSTTTSTSSTITSSTSVGNVAGVNNKNTTATSTTVQSSNLPSSNHGVVPGGAVAGIGIGAAIVGAILAAAAVWFIMSRRSGPEGGHRRRHRRSAGSAGGFEDEKFIGTAIHLEDNLLQRADDSQIKKIMIDLNEVIDQHCENHYHLQSMDISRRDLEQQLLQWGYGNVFKSGPSAAEFASMLKSTHSRMTAIRLLIAVVLIEHTGWKSRTDLSLLPPQIAGFCQKIAPVESQPGSEEIFRTAFNKWRYLSAFLIEPFRSNRGSPKPSKGELTDNIKRNVALLNSVLTSFIRSGPGNLKDQEENLSAIAFAVAELGLLLFSQPTDLVFSWSEADARNSSEDQVAGKRSGGKALVIFPGIGENIDVKGERQLRFVSNPIAVSL